MPLPLSLSPTHDVWEDSKEARDEKVRRVAGCGGVSPAAEELRQEVLKLEATLLKWGGAEGGEEVLSFSIVPENLSTNLF